MTQWIEGEVASKAHWGSDLYSLHLAADLLPFQAGQFVRLRMDFGEQKVIRSYSLVNAPHQTLHEVYFVEVNEGQLTPSLAKLTPGDRLLIQRKPMGLFTLAQVASAQTLWLIASGTGLGPFISMLRTTIPWAAFTHIVLVHAVRHTIGLTHQADIQQFKQHFGAQFCYLPIVTREASTTLRGRIPQLLANGALIQAAQLPLTPEASQILLCGNPAMIKDSMAWFISQGFKKNSRSQPGQLTTESYWQ